MWSQSPATFEGKHYQVRDAFCEPRPRTPIPILIGGHRPKLMRVAAEKADIWQWDGPVARYRAPYDLLMSGCSEIGRDPASVTLSTFGEAYFPARAADWDASLSGSLTGISGAQDPSGAYADEYDWVMGPSPEDAIRELTPMIDLGVSQVTIYFHDRRTLDLFAREVIPAFV
jgi:alkanesulfonate monooxygenase SsuD/methylene tetrahydromethanopterin reductase-like flavin-dependent oxidoreductase (luciferase family)